MPNGIIDLKRALDFKGAFPGTSFYDKLRQMKKDLKEFAGMGRNILRVVYRLTNLFFHKKERV